jgi:hypothetical protein
MQSYFVAELNRRLAGLRASSFWKAAPPLETVVPALLPRAASRRPAIRSAFSDAQIERHRILGPSLV